MKTIYLSVLLLVSSFSALEAQCVAITCPNSFSVAAASNSCGAIVNYSLPLVVNSCTSGAVVSQTFAFTGSTQTFVVPGGVNTLTIETWGAQGGANWVNNTNFGGYSKATFSVTPGQTLAVNAGGQPTTTAGGFNGGGTGDAAGKGGGGASDVRVAPYTLADRIIVGGGGGGAGFWSGLHVVGGVGGGLVGGDGFRSTTSDMGGLGGTQTAAGAFGTCSSFSNVAMAGSFGNGGNAGGNSCGCEGYGGGGGWYGGASSGNCRGGGGGSGYILPSATNSTLVAGIRTGNGQVIISYGASTTFTTSLVAGLPSATFFPVGNSVQTYSVVTSGSNSASCSFSVNVVDVSMPTLVCPSSTTVCALASASNALVSGIAPVSVIDNCTPLVTYSLTGVNTGTGTVNASGLFNVGLSSVTYMASDAAGNSATCSFSVRVGATPNVSVTANPSVVCAGQSATLTAQGASTYNWVNGPATATQVVSPVAISIYTITGAGAVSTCTNLAVFTLSVNPTPTVTALTSTSLICVGGSATLAANGASTYVWNPALGVGNVISPSVTTTYSVTGFNANGCNTQTFVTQNVSACLGLNAIGQRLEDLQVVPNPNKGTFQLKLPSNAEVNIVNAIGQIVYRKHLEAGTHTLHLNELAKGMYSLKAIGDGNTQTIKIIVE